MKIDNYTVVYNGITSNTVSVKQTEISATTYDLILSYTSSVTYDNTSSEIKCSGITILNFDDGTTSSSVTSSFTKTVTYSKNTDYNNTKTNTGTTSYFDATKTWSIVQEKAPKPLPSGVVDMGCGYWCINDTGDIRPVFATTESSMPWSCDGAIEQGYVSDSLVLKSKYDLVTQTLGSNYRTPTSEEFEELSACTTQTLENGKVKLTSKTTGKSIYFVPSYFPPTSSYPHYGYYVRDASYCGYYMYVNHYHPNENGITSSDGPCIDYPARVHGVYYP